MSMTAADRECQRYYRPWLAAHGSASTVARHLSADPDLDRQDPPGRKPLPVRDETLIAFAQNVVLRLNVQRCTISLLDATHQHVLGEATRFSSSTHPNGAPGDEILIGSATLARVDALCEHCLSSRCQPNDAQDLDGEGVIINDCHADERFANCSSVAEKERSLVRFYAGVPLVSRNGYKIGVLAVMDENPRQGLRLDEITWMRDMARNAISHLEWARDRVDRFKGERVVRGMANFIDEVSALYDNSSDSYTQHGDTPQEMQPWRQTPRRGSRNDSSNISPLAADILRDATLADGCAIFGAKAESGPQCDRDPDCSPLSRPCKLLSLSTAGQHVHNPLGTGHELPITVGNLDKYFKAAPHGRAFSFPPDPEAMSPGGDLYCAPRGKEQISHGLEIDHDELLQKVPGASNVVFLPLKHPVDHRLIAGIFLWTTTSGQMANAPPQSSPPSSPSASKTSSPSTKPHILIVDDNKINRNLLVMFMKKNSLTYEQAENGQEAVDLYTTSSFDYILMDISMPVMDGIQATRRIRELEQEQKEGPKKPIKIFALTGLASKDVREEAETAGVDLFLPKPVKFAELKELLV